MRIFELARTKPPARWRSRPSQLMASMSSSTVSREFCGRRGGRERRGSGILMGDQGQSVEISGNQVILRGNQGQSAAHLQPRETKLI